MSLCSLGGRDRAISLRSSTKMSPFKANYEQDPRIGFKGRKKEKYQGAKKFIEKMKEI